MEFQRDLQYLTGVFNESKIQKRPKLMHHAFKYFVFNLTRHLQTTFTHQTAQVLENVTFDHCTTRNESANVAKHAITEKMHVR